MDEVPQVPKYWAEEMAMHLGHANKRMLIALITVCITFILTIVVFVRGYTEREKNWLNTLSHVTEAQDGVQQQRNDEPH